MAVILRTLHTVQSLPKAVQLLWKLKSISPKEQTYVLVMDKLTLQGERY